MSAGSLSSRRGAFETLRVYRGTPFAWTRHVARLDAGARALGITAPDPRRLREGVDAVLHAEGLTEARVRMTVVEGTAAAAPDLIVGAGPLVLPPGPAGVVTAAWPRNERAAIVGLKSTAYADNVRAFADARRAGSDEAVFANTRGELCEATGSNVFVVDDGVVRTPPASSGCLPGITRELVIGLARADGMVVEEVALPIAALGAAEEAFLTSTTREVMAIGRVDGRPRPGAPGPVTARLAELYAALVAGDPDP